MSHAPQAIRRKVCDGMCSAVNQKDHDQYMDKTDHFPLGMPIPFSVYFGLSRSAAGKLLYLRLTKKPGMGPRCRKTLKRARDAQDRAGTVPLFRLLNSVGNPRIWGSV